MKIEVTKEFTPIKFGDFISTANNTDNTTDLRLFSRDEINNVWDLITGSKAEILDKFSDYLIVKFENEINVTVDGIYPLLNVFIAKSIEFVKKKVAKDLVYKFSREVGDKKDLDSAFEEILDIINSLGEE